ncbi:MAG TPA: DNA topoisomerase (ATP-hydrolyzing) [Egibacteraceae bacterium]|nr:DNA topoisomerase (ATP-hydrolyzing) [Egibacteraceae bacterium]
MSKQPSLLESGGSVVDVDIADRMEQSFLDYSMSVIVGRALPDVRDGLKPVQRRILYAMWEAGLRPDRPHRKCASAVGDVMKKYHPHGDSSIYEALVRMAQDFSFREPLIDGHGNFGSVDGDGAAAMRYTEARLSPIAMELLAGIDEDTVDFVPNYDGYESEPVVLPARFPNLLVNGGSGIAVGMATSIPPHHLGEVVDACLHLVKRPDATVDELMKMVPGPDFPTGARILDTPGIRDAYLTGRGAITMEAVASTETRSGGLPRIVVTEIPYQVNKAALQQRIADLVNDKKLEAIRDVRDESSRDGMRIVIELKRGEEPARVLDRLYRSTDLRTNFNVNLVALVNGQPRTLGLRECLVAYLDHQRDVLTRRTTYRRDKAAARAHVLEGLLTALDNLDQVIALIRAADTVDDARAELIARFALTETQATAILDMQLRRLAALERRKIVEEHRELLALVTELDGILNDPARLDGLLTGELREVRDRHGNPRRSRLATPGTMDDESLADAALPELDAQEVTVYVTAAGYLKSVARRRTSKPHTHPRDPLVSVARASTDDTLLLVDSDGNGYRVAVGDVPVTTMRQRGTTLAQLHGDGAGGLLVGAVRLDAAETVVTVSARGLAKRTESSEYTGRTRAMVAAAVRDDDELVWVGTCAEEDHLLLAHDGGQVIRFPVADVRITGRSAQGVAGLSVPEDGRVVAASVVPGGTDDEREVVTLAADGSAKRAPLSEYPTQGRGGKGVQTGVSPLAWCGLAADLHVPQAEECRVLQPAEVEEGRRAGRATPMLLPVTGPVVAEAPE